MAPPPPTAIRIFHDRIGREGARLLMDRIARPEAAPAEIGAAPELIVRGANRRSAGGR